MSLITEATPVSKFRRRSQRATASNLPRECNSKQPLVFCSRQFASRAQCQFARVFATVAETENEHENGRDEIRSTGSGPNSHSRGEDVRSQDSGDNSYWANLASRCGSARGPRRVFGCCVAGVRECGEVVALTAAHNAWASHVCEAHRNRRLSSSLLPRTLIWI